ncbi:sugar transferase [Costertonia aggregata]|uniref:Sugar transferase n=1 Tax=Costertonia aggregata TaxID=343403 RepID=A0A7H9AU09_9FLAO|nr:sugar transferase [Costertonia aggregata]QLG46685.1 sugar transferase [Costertonia aggregata]
MYTLIIKRIFDIVLASVGLIILSPIFIAITIVLFILNRGKPFFFQKRPGKNEKIFNIIKFKSMNDKTDSDGKLLPYADRITNFGHFIRNYSLDEIPQLINIIKGDMSLVGPRPLLPKYLSLYNDFQRQRHQLKPGVTGWAQVNGRNTITWDEKFKLDIWYVQNITFLLDCRIIFLTIKKVFLKEDINSSKTVNMEPFNGNN